MLNFNGIHYFTFSLLWCMINVSQWSSSMAQVSANILKDGDIFILSVVNAKEYGDVVDSIQTVMPLSTVQIDILDILPNAGFVLFQAHSHIYNITLSYSVVLTPHTYVNGTNLGLVGMMDSSSRSATFFLRNSNTFDVPVLIASQVYGKEAPIPGGCNMEFPVEVSPFLVVKYNSKVVVVDSQPASCEDTEFVSYGMYRTYLPEKDFTSTTYFTALRNMMSVDNITMKAKKVTAVKTGPPLRRVYSAYPGTASVHSVIATLGFESAAYVPAITYACDPATDSCEVLSNISVSVITGLLFGGVWIMVWWLCGIPLLSIILATLTLGFVFSAIVFFAGLADFNYLENDYNYWVVYICLMLSVPLLLIPFNQKANIISCAVLGAYAVIIPIDHYIGSNLKYIIVNIIRRATSLEFKSAVIAPPYQLRDLILTLVWVGLVGMGYVVQWQQQLGKPPFPPPPMQARRERFRRNRFPQTTATERTPLLIDARIPWSNTGDDNVFDSPPSTSNWQSFLRKLQPSAPANPMINHPQTM
uniref:DUF4203 domain-containing protein n=1 Tax=Timema shepardi TaxID=629360 RepID=A0A7R9B1H6_TIMSH|nr:unnamed protein product [Timema shepardi]